MDEPPWPCPNHITFLTRCVCYTLLTYHLIVLNCHLPDVNAIVCHIMCFLIFLNSSSPALGRPDLAHRHFCGSGYVPWFGIVASKHPVSVSLTAIMTTVAVCTATWFTISLIPSESAISILVSHGFSIMVQWSAFIGLISGLLLLTPCYVIGLLCNKKMLLLTLLY